MKKFNLFILIGMFVQAISAADAQTSANGQPLSSAAKWLVNEAVSYACDGSGQLRPSGAIVKDLDADGRDDFIIHHEWIECAGTANRPVTCGNNVCEIHIYLRRGALLEKSVEYMGLGIEFDAQSPPIIKTLGFQLQDVYTRWTGSRFENVSASSFQKGGGQSLAAFFEGQGCVATESELFDLFADASGGGLAYANQAVIDVSNRDDIQVVSRSPRTYRFTGSAICNENTPYTTVENNELPEISEELNAPFAPVLIAGAYHVTRACFATPACQRKAIELATKTGAQIVISDAPSTAGVDNNSTGESADGTQERQLKFDCEPGEHRRLQEQVDRLCKTQRKCSAADPREVLRVKEQINQQCGLARTRINATCFKGGDEGHKQSVIEASNAQLRCQILLNN